MLSKMETERWPRIFRFGFGNVRNRFQEWSFAIYSALRTSSTRPMKLAETCLDRGQSQRTQLLHTTARVRGRAVERIGGAIFEASMRDALRRAVPAARKTKMVSQNASSAEAIKN